MGSFKRKHSNWFFFFLTICAVLCQSTRRPLTECCFYMQNIHVPFSAFLHYTQGGIDWKKKERLVQIQCTTTSREMDTYSAMLYSILYNPPLRFGCWVVYKSKTCLLIQSSIDFLSIFAMSKVFYESSAAAR